MDILHSNVVVSESIWGKHCGLGNGIKQKDEKYTVDSKNSKKRRRLNGNLLKMVGERERVRPSRFA
jgi:hypothetical protein